MEKYEVINNEAGNRFETGVEGQVGFLEYKKDGNIISLLHTEVPPEIGGRGVAQSLAAHAFEYAKENALIVKNYCPFITTWLKRNPQAL